MPSVVTANDLRTGAVVYLTHDGRWVRDLQQAACASNEEELKRLVLLAQASVEANEVTAVYAFDARIVEGRPAPITVREHIRAAQTHTGGEPAHVPIR
jgi:hypothetical protein